jgi:hypothetical protein
LVRALRARREGGRGAAIGSTSSTIGWRWSTQRIPYERIVHQNAAQVRMVPEIEPEQGVALPFQRSAIHGGLSSAELSSDSSPEARRNRGRHQQRGPRHLAAERNPQDGPKTGPYDRSPVPHNCGKPRTRANFARFSRGARRSQPAWRREGDLNPRAPSAFGLLKNLRVWPIILRSFSETAHREFIRHQFDTF